jgi:chorismate mutase
MSVDLDGTHREAKAPALPATGAGRSSTAVDDPYVLQVRREISDLDRSLVELINKRLQLVAKLKRYKDEHGIGFVDLAREEWMLQYLHRLNRGPLSEDGLTELYHELLDLTKREVTRQSGGPELDPAA